MNKEILFEGETLGLSMNSNEILELVFFRKDKSVNRVDSLTRSELCKAIKLAVVKENAQGMVLSSNTELFLAGADLTEFDSLFRQQTADILTNLAQMHDIFNAIEDAPFPTVSIINGVALGGGFEVALSTDFRVLETNASVGFPEVNFGIFPAWGGTIRLSRICGVETAIEWIAGGRNQNSKKALTDGAVDTVSDKNNLHEIAIKIINNCNDGLLDHEAVRQEKNCPIKLNKTEINVAIHACKQHVSARSMIGNTASSTVVNVIDSHAQLSRQEAQKVESLAAVKLAKKPIVKTLISSFLQSNRLEGRYKKKSKSSEVFSKCAVLGAGIMGAGIAYQTALKGTPTLIKDINKDALNGAIVFANSAANKRLKRKRLSAEDLGSLMNNISTSTTYEQFSGVDLVIEAVSENERLKSSVLQESEKNSKQGTVITTNTSTISISQLARGLSRPASFCGMHFFNPVDRMLLVEVIRGEQTSDDTIQRVVKHALKLGKKPVVVNDCAGFLVNRILYPYILSFCQLVEEGISVKKIDDAMRSIGWPVGPGLLIDIIGIDVLVHSAAVLAEAYPDRMPVSSSELLSELHGKGNLGQKSGAGFYLHSKDERGRIKQKENVELSKQQTNEHKSSKMSEQEIVDRMMIPLCIEAVRCLEDEVIETAEELDYALTFGIGFPPSQGGAIRYMENYGLQAFCKKVSEFSELGVLFFLTDSILENAEKKHSYFLS